MAGIWNKVNRKAEDALAELIWSRAGENLQRFLTAKTSIFRGSRGVELVSPRIEVLCSRAEPERLPGTRFMTGNFHCTMEVAFVANYDRDADQRADAMAETWDILISHSLPQDVNSLVDVPDFYIIDDGNLQGIGWTVEELTTEVLENHEYVEVLRGDMYCRPSGKGALT